MAWAERALGSNARVVGWRRMTGGIIAAVHRLTIECTGHRCQLVLRQYEDATAENARLVEQEAAVLGAVGPADLLAPELVAFSAAGIDTDGHPSLLMTRLPGHIYLSPTDPGAWLQQIARTAASVHEAGVPAPPFQRWADAANRPIPVSATRPHVWHAMSAVLRQQHGSPASCFLHRDFQHFNFLWRRGRLTGVVDWSMASTGPPEIDVGHCRLNLAVLFGVDWAERFRVAYEAETGRAVDPWWDLQAIATYDDAWSRFIPVQVAGRVPVDSDGMTARVEDLMESSLRRL